MPPFADLTARCRQVQRDWADQCVRDRLAPVRRLRHLLAEHGDRLALTATQDIGRPAPEVVATDVLPTADALRFLERRAARILRPKRVPRSLRPWWLLGERETVYRRPVGVVGVIGTWNYPVLLNAVPIAQALAAGNGVLWKPSELTPTAGEYMHDLFRAAGFPDDLFVRLPAVREVGPQLLEADIDHLIFTGSADVGRRVAARLAERLIPCTLELSGCDALVVLEDADVPLAAKAAWFGATLNAGQTCLAVRRAFVHRSRYAEFREALRPLAAGRRAEPLALMSQATQAERLVSEAVASGATVLTTATPVAEDDPPRFPPTAVFDAAPGMAVCREASFAPLLAVVPFDHEAELVEVLEQCPYGLGASVWTADARRAGRLAARIRAGSVAVNDVIVGTAHPATGFGGVRQSGWGVTRGEDGLLSLTVPQVLTTRSGRFRPHYDPDNPAVADVLGGLLAWTHAAAGGDRRRGLWRMLAGLRRFGRKPG